MDEPWAKKVLQTFEFSEVDPKTPVIEVIFKSDSLALADDPTTVTSPSRYRPRTVDDPGMDDDGPEPGGDDGRAFVPKRARMPQARPAAAAPLAEPEPAPVAAGPRAPRREPVAANCFWCRVKNNLLAIDEASPVGLGTTDHARAGSLAAALYMAWRGE